MDPIDLAWAAGFFEGEGSVRITNIAKRNFGSVCVSVVNTDKTPIEWLNSQWPGYCKKATGIKGNRKQAYVWVVAARKAVVFLEAIRPYVKRAIVEEKIALALKFQEQKKNSRAVKNMEEYKAQQTEFFITMKRLNLRGLAATKPETKKREEPMTDALLILIANRDCKQEPPGHVHSVKKVEMKNGTWNGKTHIEDHSQNTFGVAEMECIK